MPKRTNAARPEPVPVNVVCSLCGEAWNLHREQDGEVTTLECIRLLKAAKLRIGPTYIHQPYAYPSHPTWWTSPYLQGTYTQTNTGNSGHVGYTTNIASVTPRVLAASSA